MGTHYPLQHVSSALCGPFLGTDIQYLESIKLLLSQYCNQYSRKWYDFLPLLTGTLEQFF